MSSVALVGPDGAGKTTIARKLEAEPGLRVRYLYMGVSVDSSNVTLPTTRWAQRIKEILRTRARGADPSGGTGPSGGGSPSGGAEPSGGGDPSRGADPSGSGKPSGGAGANGAGASALPKGRLWATARLLNRVAEEWYRQLLAWWYQLRGHVIVYDRHYVFDFRGSDVEARNRTLSKRIHRWLLVHLYPRPDLVLCLDAPGEVLFARKGEKSPEALEARRRAFLRQGEEMEGFVRVDATRPPEEVYAEVLRHVRSLAGDPDAPSEGVGAPPDGAVSPSGGAGRRPRPRTRTGVGRAEG